MLKNPFIKDSGLNQYQPLINQINALETNLKTLTDTELRNKTFELKKRYQEEQDLNALTAEAFAITREASFRTLGLRHFDVQLIGGLVLNSGKISEMRTGEGKTLVATLPAYLNALTDKGVHIVTVNDYLASRDQISMGQIYRFLGLDTGLIQEDMAFLERQQNYKAEITYVTNNEVAFDYLRDNMASNLSQVVLPPFNYCIVDEVDSIFIDEAQVPLIISQAVETCIDKYIVAAEVAEYLEVNVHFKVDEKNRNIILTEQGTAQIEKILQVEDLYNPNDPWIPYILSAIKATALFFRNVHYIVQNNQIIIVDEFTGRIMPDRRWNEGLHQAVEAKEGVPIRQNTETAASITYQNFFLLYPKLSGMTGTAKTSEVEFEKIYNLPVEEIPTARPNLRKDLPDFVYKDSLTKWTAIARECKSIANTKQPILIGTTTVENSEMLADLLQEYQLSYRLLNAKPENVKRESEIVAQAGEIGSITIATNMAGRGTDIILGGNTTFKVRKQLYNILVSYKSKTNLTKLNTIFPLAIDIKFTSQKFLSVLNSLLNDPKFLSLSSTGILKFLNEIDQIRIPKITYQCSIKFLLNELSKFEKKNQTIDNKIVKNLGGLYIIGTERNNSRRIDNQLRGRCGRQGDPGTSRFFLSLEDSLFRNFGSSKLQNFMQNQLLDDLPLESNLLTKSLDAAQKRVEERDYDGRKYLFDYDDILNKQRNIVYYERRKLLESQSLRETILAYGEQVIKDIITLLKDPKFPKTNSMIEELFKTRLVSLNSDLNSLDSFELKTYLFQEFWLSYETKVLEFEICQTGLIRSFERTIILYYTDIAWKEHLQKIALLRDAVGWRSYGQRNPLFEFKEEAYNLFQNRNITIRHLLIRDFLHSFIL
jgi:preprotein translocase subunit SecA|uniref:Protein translocase subunit SecA n=2 Tax=Thalassiosira pseudonana TaxID=35128 RepID=SECA_THAPS|nr:preprotein translocase subunit SecA [Thalassiosira pseudonana]YP_874624.1 preprotein translocase subunit SecA [Thalassiosira pseudonana]A0T0V8.1 RecName: Full=Protein translocase subunit SecA [Thalassiosira pseudonana]ABK20793.1 preprotein translocase subunit A [Thalassiosira pseudonana]ABK20847.1 preprotein translocase subunit A [Thalassiosira pseudonana]QWM93031.1 subunit A of preprotein-translocase [Thalassiosira pseudonana]QWM93085.1 subunit A of preprotein-translocase [Thalassiosira p